MGGQKNRNKKRMGIGGNDRNDDLIRDDDDLDPDRLVYISYNGRYIRVPEEHVDGILEDLPENDDDENFYHVGEEPREEDIEMDIDEFIDYVNEHVEPIIRWRYLSLGNHYARIRIRDFEMLLIEDPRLRMFVVEEPREGQENVGRGHFLDLVRLYFLYMEFIPEVFENPNRIFYGHIHVHRGHPLLLIYSLPRQESYVIRKLVQNFNKNRNLHTGMLMEFNTEKITEMYEDITRKPEPIQRAIRSIQDGTMVFSTDRFRRILAADMSEGNIDMNPRPVRIRF